VNNATQVPGGQAVKRKVASDAVRKRYRAESTDDGLVADERRSSARLSRISHDLERTVQAATKDALY
jgi:hypothetical protein